jgi:hypothetical protein
MVAPPEATKSINFDGRRLWKREREPREEPPNKELEAKQQRRDELNQRRRAELNQQRRDELNQKLDALRAVWCLMSPAWTSCRSSATPPPTSRS